MGSLLRRLAALSLLSALAACGGAAREGGAATTPSSPTRSDRLAHSSPFPPRAEPAPVRVLRGEHSLPSADAEDVPPPATWSSMSPAARRAHMVQHVLPRASELFTGWDGTRYGGTFSCTTCHGADAEARSFAMPNPALLALYPTGTVGQEQVLAQYTEACTFMYSRLVPSMQTMLGAETFDPATGRGFTCFSCHPRAAEDDPLNRPASSHP